MGMHDIEERLMHTQDLTQRNSYQDQGSFADIVLDAKSRNNPGRPLG